MLVEIIDDLPGIYSALFAIPKSTGGYRPIVNLKPLNAFIVYEHFKMESFETAKTLERKGDWLAKLDLKDAYLTVPFAVEHQKFLRFCWEGRKYQFLCLPFGLCSAPRIFSKIMKAVVSFFRKKGVRMVVYLDDMLFFHQDRIALSKQLEFVSLVLTNLGFVINTEKSIISPTQQLEFLGMNLNSVDLVISLPTKKLQKIIEQSSKALKDKRIVLRDLASLLGLLA